MEGPWYYAGIEHFTTSWLSSRLTSQFGTKSLGWEHYEVHEPEPHILLFKWVQFMYI